MRGETLWGLPLGGPLHGGLYFEASRLRLRFNEASKLPAHVPPTFRPSRQYRLNLSPGCMRCPTVNRCTSG